MKARRIERPEDLAPGLVLARDAGKLRKGHVLGPADVATLRAAPFAALNALELEAGDLHEQEAGSRLARAAAGPGVEPGAMEAGSFPLVARSRGLLELQAEQMVQVNLIGDLAVYAHPPGTVVVEGDVIGRAKVVPFVTREEKVRRAEELCAGILLRVRPFVAMRGVLLVQEDLQESALERARRSFEEKLAFFGSSLGAARLVPGAPETLVEALREEVRSGARLIVVAGSRSMDPLDPVMRAIEAAGARLEKHGVPAYPGTLLWLAWLGDAAIVGAPGCGIFSRASALDFVLPLLMTGARVGAEELAGLSVGGIVTPENSLRLAPYRKGISRGQLE